MSQPRNGSAPDFNVSLDYEAPCDNCKAYQDHGCECLPCFDCALPTSPKGLNKGIDSNRRCGACHVDYEEGLDANPRLCRERPAFRPTVSDLRAASWAMFARGAK